MVYTCNPQKEKYAKATCLCVTRLSNVFLNPENAVADVQIAVLENRRAIGKIGKTALSSEFYRLQKKGKIYTTTESKAIM